MLSISARTLDAILAIQRMVHLLQATHPDDRALRAERTRSLVRHSHRVTRALKNDELRPGKRVRPTRRTVR